MTTSPHPAPSPVNANDADLAARSVLGDRDAFAGLVMPVLPRARQLAARALGAPDEADDLVQDAVLRAIERLSQFDRSRPFAPWFLRLVINLAHSRRDSLALRAHEPLDELGVAGTAASPGDSAERAEIRAAFDDAVGRLSPRQRTIVMLFDVDGYTGAEIAEMLGLSAETVRWHLHVGRTALRTALARFRP